MNIDELKIANNKQTTFLALRSLCHYTDNGIAISIQTITAVYEHNYSQLWRFGGSKTNDEEETTSAHDRKCLKNKLSIRVSMACPLNASSHSILCSSLSALENPLPGIIDDRCQLLLHAAIATRSTNRASVSVMHTQTFRLSLR